MAAGMPGTGIGGTFYLLLVALMPLRELWVTLKGGSSVRRWLDVTRSLGLGAGICGSLYAEYRIMRVTFLWLSDNFSSSSLLHRAGQIGNTTVTPALAATALLVLLCIVVGLELLRRAFPLRPPESLALPAPARAQPEAGSGQDQGAGGQGHVAQRSEEPSSE